MKDFLSRMENFTRTNFRFHAHIRDAADATLRDVASRVKKSDPRSDVTFVGIHNRRTDHLQFVQRIAKVKPVGKSYFKDAMEYFRLPFNVD